METNIPTPMAGASQLLALCPSLAATLEARRDADPLYQALAAATQIAEPGERLVALSRIEASLPEEVRLMKRKGFAQVGSVAVVPLVGSLQKDGDWYSRYSTYYSSTRDFSAALYEASRTKGVKSILLYTDSPGGLVDGTAEAGDAVAALVESGFPVVAYASGMMASAAYWIGSQASAIYSDRTSDIGSIGVRMAFLNVSAALAERGITVESFTTGKFKDAGNPYRPMSDEHRAYFQAQVEATAQEFYAAVAQGRMKRKRQGASMSPESFARVTGEAGVYDPRTALSLGLIDGIDSIAGVLASLNSAAR